MRFYTKNRAHYCGIDLHAKTMYLCIFDKDGQIVLHKNMKSRPEAFLAAVEPFREDLVVAVECIFTGYWLADLCRQEGIEFVLGHALYKKAIHGGKAKNDAFKIATLLRGGSLPKAYAYPPEMRATRDLLRRRQHLVRRRPGATNHAGGFLEHGRHLQALIGNPPPLRTFVGRRRAFLPRVLPLARARS